MLDKQIVEIARASRRWAMRNRDRFDCEHSLGGMCAIASGNLHRRLKKHGISSKLAINKEHCFVIVHDHLIDITATQFNDWDHDPKHKPVCIHSLEPTSNEYWWFEETFDSIKSLYDYQRNSGWPMDQAVLLKERTYVN